MGGCVRVMGNPVVRLVAGGLALALASTLAGTALVSTGASAASGAEVARSGAVERIAGPDRVTTGLAVSQRFWDASADVVLATATDFPDALAGGALAARLDAPLLLTPPGHLPETVAAELVRLDAGTVWVLGGPTAVSVGVEQQLAAMGLEVHRVSGTNRFGTAVAVADEMGTDAGEVILALGAHPDANRAWPDALAAGSLAAVADQPPTLLTLGSSVPPETVAGLADLGADQVVLAGGSAAISDDVAVQLEGLGYGVRRIAGHDRFATSSAFVAEVMARLPADRSTADPPVVVDGPVPLVLATGARFPDALTAGALAARLGGSILLVPADDLDAARHVRAFVQTHGADFAPVVAVGGTAAISGLVLDQIAADLVEELHQVVVDDGEATLYVAPAALPPGESPTDLRVVRRNDHGIEMDQGEVAAVYDLQPSGLELGSDALLVTPPLPEPDAGMAQQVWALQLGDGFFGRGSRRSSLQRAEHALPDDDREVATAPPRPPLGFGKVPATPAGGFKLTSLNNMVVAFAGAEAVFVPPPRREQVVGVPFTVRLRVLVTPFEALRLTNSEGGWDLQINMAPGDVTSVRATWTELEHTLAPTSQHQAFRHLAGVDPFPILFDATFTCHRPGPWRLTTGVGTSGWVTMWQTNEPHDPTPTRLGPDVPGASVRQAVSGDCLPAPELTVTKSGPGSGRVTSSPPGIDCGGTCTASFAPGTEMTLTAVADPDSEFVRWSGDCVGRVFEPDEAALTMNAAGNTCDAEFRFRTFILVPGYLTVVGTGTGSIHVEGGGVDEACEKPSPDEAACIFEFSKDSVVTITPHPDLGSAVAGSEGCTPPVPNPDNACTVVADAEREVMVELQGAED